MPREGAAPRLQHRGHCGRSQHKHSLQSSGTGSGKDEAAPEALGRTFLSSSQRMYPPTSLQRLQTGNYTGPERLLGVK